jgi:hypothetical protein
LFLLLEEYDGGKVDFKGRRASATARPRR